MLLPVGFGHVPAPHVEPSLLLHPLDFLDGTESPALDFFPAMRVPWRKKIGLLHRYLEALQSRFDIVPLSEHAALADARDLPSRAPQGADPQSDGGAQ